MANVKVIEEYMQKNGVTWEELRDRYADLPDELEQLPEKIGAVGHDTLEAIKCELSMTKEAAATAFFDKGEELDQYIGARDDLHKQYIKWLGSSEAGKYREEYDKREGRLERSLLNAAEEIAEEAWLAGFNYAASLYGTK